MKRDRAENIIKQKVKDLEVQTFSADHGALWEQLNTRLKHAPRRRRFPIYYAAAAAILLVVVCIAFLMRQEASESTTPIVVNSEKSIEAVRVIHEEEIVSKETQALTIAPQSPQLPGKHRVNRHDSKPQETIEDELEQMGRDAENGLYANPVASNICNSENETVYN